MQKNIEPAGVPSDVGWLESDYDRFQQAGGTARRRSIAEVYEAVNAHPVPGTSICPSIEVTEPNDSSTWSPPIDTFGTGLPQPPLETRSVASSRRSSITVPPRSDADILAAEDFRHVPRIPQSTYTRIANFHEEQRVRSSAHAELPGIDALSVFVQLYFEYHQSKLPVLHKATFAPSEDNWHLVLAVAAVGCEHSELCSIQLMTMFEHLAMRAISIAVSHPAATLCQEPLLTFADDPSA